MKKYALGAPVVALGIVHQAPPASADKLDDLIKRMDAIEQNNKQLAKENAALRSQLRTKPAPATTTIMAAPAGKPGATVTGVATPPHALDAPEIDAQGHGFLEHKKGNPLTFYTPGGEITAYGNFDISIDNTTKNLNNFDTSFAPPSTPFPVGNFGWMAGDFDQLILPRVCAASSACPTFRSTSFTSLKSATTFPQPLA